MHTPANTLVISSTLTPANGSAAVSTAPVAGVARHRLCRTHGRTSRDVVCRKGLKQCRNTIAQITAEV